MGLSLRKKPAEQKAGEGACGKKVPQKGHGEIFQYSTDPYGGELGGGNAAEDDIEQDSGSGTHGGAHDENGAAGDHQSAEKGVILTGIDQLCGKPVPDAVSPEIGKQENQYPHECGFFEGFGKNKVCHIAEAAGQRAVAQLMGHIENLHAIGHGDGHEDTKDDFLHFCFRHNETLLCCFKNDASGGLQKKETARVSQSFVFCAAPVKQLDLCVLLHVVF